jgi:glucose/mannose-6-phosphate isomerase
VDNLNDVNAMKEIDRSDLLGQLTRFADQCAEAVEIGRRVELTIDSDQVQDILVLGMGGSGISGDVCRVLFDDRLALPLYVNRHYHLPAFVGSQTLVIAVSYSGNTEETLSGLAEAMEKGAQVIILSSGGRLGQIASSRVLDYIQIPSGLQPRASLGYLSLPLAVVFGRLGLVDDSDAEIEEMLAVLRRQSEELSPGAPEESNAAKALARRFFGRMPVIYGSEGLTGLAAFRLKCQINENAKSPAQWNLLPELNHNEITGWQFLEDLSRRFNLTFLRDAEEHPQVKKRVEITRDLIAGQFSSVEEIWSEGRSKLARLFSLIYLGDFASAYLALLNGIDPSPVERIELLKERLK